MSKAILVNLSALHTLKPIYPNGIDCFNKGEYAIEAFAKLHKRYAPKDCSSGLFTALPSTLWTVLLYLTKCRDRIESHREGTITFDALSDDLRESCTFLVAAAQKFIDNDEANQFDPFDDFHRIRQNKDHFLSTMGKEPLQAKHYANALLEEALNYIISFEEQDVQKFNNLLTINQDSNDPIYLFSNSTPANIFKIWMDLKAKFSKVFYDDEENNLRILGEIVDNESHGKIQIGPNIFFYVSYKEHERKTNVRENEIPCCNTALHMIQSASHYINCCKAADQEQQPDYTKTPGLIKKLVEEILGEQDNEIDDIKDITLISQYPRDRQVAINDVKIPEENVLSENSLLEKTYEFAPTPQIIS